jgi:hypothetical protein
MLAIYPILASLLEGVGIAMGKSLDSVNYCFSKKPEPSRMNWTFSLQSLDMGSNPLVRDAIATVIATLTIKLVLVRLASMRHDGNHEGGWSIVIHRIPSRRADRWLANTYPMRNVDDRPPADGSLFALITAPMNCPLVMKH